MASLVRHLCRDFSPALTEGLSERLHGTYSLVVMLVLAGLMLSQTGYSGDRIACVTKYGSQADFTYMSCWSQDTYWISTNSTGGYPDGPKRTPVFNIGKYSGYIAIGLALLLLLPKMLSKYTGRKRGISVESILELASASSSHKRVAEIAKAVSTFLGSEKRKSTKFTTMIIFTKLAYLAISAIQIVLIHIFFGINLKSNLSSDVFPYVVYCDHNNPRYTDPRKIITQCALPVNSVYQTLWVLFFMWATAVMIIGVLSLIKFIITLSVENYQIKFISHRLAIKGNIQSASDSLSRNFAQSFLGRDGYFIVKLMSENVGEDITIDVIDRLWARWRQSTTDDDTEAQHLTPQPNYKAVNPRL